MMLIVVAFQRVVLPVNLEPAVRNAIGKAPGHTAHTNTARLILGQRVVTQYDVVKPACGVGTDPRGDTGTIGDHINKRPVRIRQPIACHGKTVSSHTEFGLFNRW